MIEHRPFSELGEANLGWLEARLHFIMGDLGNPRHVALGPLRVWNDDTFAPHSGFPLHMHRDVEIITYVRDGAITHKDNLGNEGRIRAGDVQVMTAGRGIFHSEFNAEDTHTRLFQIWIDARTGGLPACWATRRFPELNEEAKFTVLASSSPGHEGLQINANANVLGASLRTGETIFHSLPMSGCAYLVPTVGRIEVNGHVIGPRDGAAIHGEREMVVTSLDDTEIIMVELH